MYSDATFQLLCYVDLDIKGLFGSEDPDPDSVKFKTGYLIKFRNVPFIWVCKLQIQIAHSTIELAYIFSYLSMRDLIPLQDMVKEILWCFQLVLKH